MIRYFGSYVARDHFMRNYIRETRKWENKKMGEKEKRERILQQHYKRAKDRKSGWI